MAMYGHGDVMKEEADDLLKLFRIAKKVSCRGRGARELAGVMFGDPTASLPRVRVSTFFVRVLFFSRTISGLWTTASLM